MKIECILRRTQGTVVELPDPTIEYHFKPSDNDPRHLAEVDEQTHIQMLLRIPEGYRAAEQSEQVADIDTDPIKLLGSVQHNPIYVIAGGSEIELDEVVELAQKDSGLTPDAWNDLDDQDRHEWIDQVLADLKAVIPSAAKTPPIPEKDDQPEGFIPAAVQMTPEQIAAQQEADKLAAEKLLADQAAADKAAADKAAGLSGGPAATVEEVTKELKEAYKAVYNRWPAKAMTAAQIKRAIEEA